MNLSNILNKSKPFNKCPIPRLRETFQINNKCQKLNYYVISAELYQG